MPQPDHVMALPVPAPESLDPDLQAHFAKCLDKLGLVPNVLRAYSARPKKLRNFISSKPHSQRPAISAVGFPLLRQRRTSAES